MKITERINRFWNNTLGVDCPDEPDILTSENPEDKELKASLARVANLEKSYRMANTSSTKGGKGSSTQIVEKVEINSSKVVKQEGQKAVEQKVKDSREER